MGVVAPFVSRYSVCGLSGDSQLMLLELRKKPDKIDLHLASIVRKEFDPPPELTDEALD